MKETLLIDDKTIRENIKYDDLVQTIRDAFKAYDDGNVIMPPKSYIDVEKYNGDFRSMPAYIDSESIEGSGVKWVNVHPDNSEYPSVMAVIVYTNPENGFPLAVLNGTEITGLRTGAVAGVATDELAPDYINTLGIIGAGAQSYEQVNSIESVRDFNQILISDPSDSAVDRFKDKYDGEYEVIRSSTEEVAESSDVISTLTPVEEPIISNVPEGIHINAMGADSHTKQELDSSIITDENNYVFVDDMKQALHSGEVSQSYHNRELEESDIESTLGRLVNSPNDYSNETTIFDSTGLAIQDIAVSNLIYNKIKNNENLDKFRFV